MGSYDFASLYGQADSSIFVYDAGEVDAVVESSTWGRTKDGTKGQWDIRFRVTTGPNAGRAQIRFPMTITADSPQALGIMFRHLEALGIPSTWLQTNPPEEQIAQAMVGKPVLLKITVDEWEGVQRNKVRDVRPPRPGAPTTWPQYQAPAVAPNPGYGQQQMTYGAPPQFPQPQQAPGPYGQPQQPAFPTYPGYEQTAPYGAQQPPQQAPAPAAPWQQVNGAPAQNGGQPPANPAVPSWAQPPVPGAGGLGEFTTQGQSTQPSTAPFPPQQPQQNPAAAPPQYAAPQPFQPSQQPPAQQGQAPAGPPPMPWAQQPAAQQPQPEQAAGPQGAPTPPWAQ